MGGHPPAHLPAGGLGWGFGLALTEGAAGGPGSKGEPRNTEAGAPLHGVGSLAPQGPVGIREGRPQAGLAGPSSSGRGVTWPRRVSATGQRAHGSVSEPVPVPGSQPLPGAFSAQRAPLGDGDLSQLSVRRAGSLSGGGGWGAGSLSGHCGGWGSTPGPALVTPGHRDKHR